MVNGSSLIGLNYTVLRKVAKAAALACEAALQKGYNVYKDVNAPLIEDRDQQNKFLVVLWILYSTILFGVLFLEKNLMRFIDGPFFSLLLLLYATYYLSCRAKGKNFLFPSFAFKPYTLGWLITSDIVAVGMYASCLVIIFFRL